MSIIAKLFLLTVFKYLVVMVIILVIVRFVTGSNKIVAVMSVVLILLPFWRDMLVSTVFRFYDLTPLQEIHKTIDKPGSVYWEDNVWPGFTEYYKKAMIECYLDGINLQTLALNGDDGIIYLFSAKPEDYAKSNALLPEIEKRKKEIYALSARGAFSTKEKAALAPFKKQYQEQLSKDIQVIIDRAEVFNSPKDLPFMNYKVEFNKVPVSPSFLKSIIIADKITITDNKTKSLIAFSKRYLAYSGWLAKFSGNQPKFGKVLGYHAVYKFDNKVLFEYAKNKGSDTRHEHELRDKKL